MNELEHLRLIFPDRTLPELQRVLLRHNNSVEEAVEAILNGETNDAEQNDTNEATAIESAIPAVGPTMAVLPPLENTAEERRRTLLNAQKAALENEERELQDALRNSLAPSNRGLDYISDEQLAELMNDPVFLASLDNDLREAVVMQSKLEAAEEEWKAVENEKAEASASKPALQTALSGLSASALSHLKQRKRLKKLGASFMRARSSLGIATSEEEQLVEQLEAINRENEEEQLRRRIRLEAKHAMLAAVRNHLQSFLAQNPNASYEHWIEELHPENAQEGQLLEGLDKTIDHRFYVEESEHRQLWNESCETDPSKTRSLVSPRSTQAGSARKGAIDLLSSPLPTVPCDCGDPGTNEKMYDPFEDFG